jgi:hypothetical protein
MLIVWLLAMVALTLFITPLEWQRYYLPVHPPILLLAGSGISALYMGIVHLIKPSTAAN